MLVCTNRPAGHTTALLCDQDYRLHFLMPGYYEEGIKHQANPLFDQLPKRHDVAKICQSLEDFRWIDEAGTYCCARSPAWNCEWKHGANVTGPDSTFLDWTEGELDVSSCWETLQRYGLENFIRVVPAIKNRMSYNLCSLKGLYRGFYKGVFFRIKGDARRP